MAMSEVRWCVQGGVLWKGELLEGFLRTSLVITKHGGVGDQRGLDKRGLGKKA